MRPLLPCAFLALSIFACGGAETQNTAVLAPPPTSTAEPAPSAAPAASATAGATPPPVTTPTTGGTAYCPDQGPIHFAGGNGSSMKNAVVIQGAHGEMDGTGSEYKCLDAVHGPRRNGSWKLLTQSLLSDGGKSYDLMELQLPSGKIEKVFFDITDYFGKL